MLDVVTGLVTAGSTVGSGGLPCGGAAEVSGGGGGSAGGLLLTCGFCAASVSGWLNTVV